MDFKKVFLPVVILSSLFFFTACNEKDKANTDNTFYVELVNFSKDSLKQKLSKELFGKVSYYQNGQLKIISVNYITEQHDDMHYFMPINADDKNIKENSKKIRAEFKGSYSADSISYLLQKFVYTNNAWKKYSDMGIVKATNSYQKAKEFSIDEYGKQLLNTIVLYSYN